MPSRLGCPNSVRRGLKAFALLRSIFRESPARLPAPAGTIWEAAAWASAKINRMVAIIFFPLLRLWRRPVRWMNGAAIVAFKALLLAKLEARFDSAMEQHADLPRLGIGLRIFERRFVLNRIRACSRIAFDH